VFSSKLVLLDVLSGTMDEHQPLAKRYARIASVVALYWFVSITMVFVNKVIRGHLQQ